MRTVVRNFLALASGEAVARVIAFAAYLYLARTLGAASYGIIAFAAGVTLYLAKFADFAIEAVGTSEVAKNRESIPRFAAAVLGARIALAGVLILVATVFVQVFADQPDRTVLSLYFLTLIPIAASTKWIHMGLENALPVGAWRVGGELTFFGLVLAFVRGPDDMWLVPLALLAGECLSITALYVNLRRAGFRFGLRWDPKTAIPVFRAAAPVLSQYILGLVLYNSDLLFLRFMRDSQTVGYYAAAYMLISFLANIGLVYAISLLPTLARQTKGQHDQRELYQTALAHVFAATLPVAVGGTFVAGGIITLAFGTGYTDSILVQQILMWVVPVAILRSVPWSALMVRGDQGPLVRAGLYAVLVNVSLNLTLIPFLGMVGAAIATVVAEPVACGVMLKSAASRGLPIVPGRRLWKPGLAALCMGVTLFLLGDAALAVQITVGAVVYLGVLYLSGGIKQRRGIPILDV